MSEENDLSILERYEQAEAAASSIMNTSIFAPKSLQIATEMLRELATLNAKELTKNKLYYALVSNTDKYYRLTIIQASDFVPPNNITPGLRDRLSLVERNLIAIAGPKDFYQEINVPMYRVEPGIEIDENDNPVTYK